MIALLIEWNSIVIALIAGVFSSGFGAGIVALLKMRPEAGQITVNAAQGALIVQTGVIETLRDELKSVRTDLHAVELEHKDCEERLEKVEDAFKTADKKYVVKDGWDTEEPNSPA